MSSIVEIYTESIKENFSPLHANWEPGGPLRLGDYGYLEDNVLIHRGNIEDLGITFEEIKDTTPDTKTFSTKSSTEIKLSAKGNVDINGVVNANAKLELNFSNEKAVFFNAAGCLTNMIRNKTKIGKEILARYEEGNWERSFVIVTDIILADSTTIVISGGNNSSIVFEATGDVKQIDLADASIGLNISSQKNVGYVIKAEKGLIPLMGLSKIQSKFLWWGDTFKPIKLLNVNSSLIQRIQDKNDIKTEESIEDLYFGQLK